MEYFEGRSACMCIHMQQKYIWGGNIVTLVSNHNTIPHKVTLAWIRSIVNPIQGCLFTDLLKYAQSLFLYWGSFHAVVSEPVLSSSNGKLFSSFFFLKQI